METDTPRAAILGGPELDDIRAQLDALGIPHREAGRVDFGAHVPLLISSASGSRDLAAGRADAPRHLMHIAVCADLGERIDAGLLLVRPVADSVLRQLTRRRDSEDSERRLATRVALGVAVKVSCDGDRREVILDRISIGGCGLKSPARLRSDAKVQIEMPSELTHPRELVLTGRTKSCQESTDNSRFDVAVLFDPLDLSDRVTLRALMGRHAVDYQPSSPDVPREASALRARIRNPRDERRGNARRRFQRRVVATCEGYGLVLMGRDLSDDGLRVEYHVQLSAGDGLMLALFDEPSTPPLLLRADVERDDTPGGNYLRFASPASEAQTRLDALLKTLAPLDLDPS